MKTHTGKRQDSFWHHQSSEKTQSERHGASFDSCNLGKANPRAPRFGRGGDTDSLKKFFRVHLLSAPRTSAATPGDSPYPSRTQLCGAQEFQDQRGEPVRPNGTGAGGTRAACQNPQKVALSAGKLLSPTQ